MQIHTRLQTFQPILSVLATNTYMSFGEQLKKWRKAKGLTQAELATAADIKSAYMSNLERDYSTGKKATPRPSESLVARFAKVLGVDLDDMREAAG